jgi:hypothetical protein
MAEHAAVFAACALVLAGGTTLEVEGGKARIGGHDLPYACLLRGTPAGGCPGCGLTRSVVALCHLRWEDSVEFHPGGCVIVGIALVQGVDRLRCMALRRRPHRGAAGLTRGAMLAVLILGLARWATRILGG